MSKRAAGKDRGDGARRAILAAAEAQLVANGPAALRLQEVAAIAGVSHPAVLHHFGSREGLVKAVVEHAVRGLQEQLSEAIADAGAEGPDGAALFERVFDVLFSRGHARLVAWLLLSGHDPFAGEGVRAGWARITEATHAMRPRRGSAPTVEDTRFTIVLSALALFGEAVAGKATFEAAGLGRSAAVGKRFRGWLAQLLVAHLSQ